MTQFPPPRCAAGFIFALETEADPFAMRVCDATTLRGPALSFHEGTIAGRRVAWVVSGAGVAAAGQAATVLLEGHAPGLLVSAGFAGGLDPALARGALVLATGAVREGAPRLPLARPASLLPAASTDVDIVTVDSIVATIAAKRDLRAATGAAIVDMETHAVAVAAAAARIPCASVRIVSDAAGDELPADIARLVIPQSAFRRAGAALAAIGRKPAAAGTLWRLWEHAVVDSRALAAALESLVAALPEA
jgi:adenosylhomocysteine nucleosidase